VKGPVCLFNGIDCIKLIYRRHLEHDLNVKILHPTVAIVVCSVWIYLLNISYSGAGPWVQGLVFIVIYLTTSALLVASYRQGTTLGFFTKSVCVVTTSFVTSIFWILIIDSLTSPLYIHNGEYWISFSSLLMPGIIATTLVSAALIIPSSVLFNKHFWSIPVLAIVFWALLPGSLLSFLPLTSVSGRIILFEATFFVLAIPLILNKICPSVRKWISIAAIQDKAAGAS
jgi:hypothetical protein